MTSRSREKPVSLLGRVAGKATWGYRQATSSRRSLPDFIVIGALGKSRYAEQLEAWFAEFPKEQFAIYKSEELFAGETDALTELYSFLGLSTDPETINALPKANAAPHNEPIDQGLSRELSDYFAEHNRRLYDLIGRDLGWT